MGRTRNTSDSTVAGDEDCGLVMRILTVCGKVLEPLGLDMNEIPDTTAYAEIRAWKVANHSDREDSDIQGRVIKRGAVSVG